MNLFKWFKKRKVISKFKVNIKGKEIVEVQIIGKTPKYVAGLSNKIKSLLSMKEGNMDELLNPLFKQMDNLLNKKI